MEGYSNDEGLIFPIYRLMRVEAGSILPRRDLDHTACDLDHAKSRFMPELEYVIDLW